MAVIAINVTDTVIRNCEANSRVLTPVTNILSIGIDCA